MGVIREEGGRMHMRDANFAEAYNEFYAGFRAYQEAGNSRAKDCLKYVVLANMLVRSRRPAVLRCLHAVDATRLHQTRPWVVYFLILSRFGP